MAIGERHLAQMRAVDPRPRVAAQEHRARLRGEAVGGVEQRREGGAVLDLIDPRRGRQIRLA